MFSLNPGLWCNLRALHVDPHDDDSGVQLYSSSIWLPTHRVGVTSHVMNLCSAGWCPNSTLLDVIYFVLEVRFRIPQPAVVKCWLAALHLLDLPASESAPQSWAEMMAASRLADQGHMLVTWNLTMKAARPDAANDAPDFVRPWPRSHLRPRALSK